MSIISNSVNYATTSYGSIVEESFADSAKYFSLHDNKLDGTYSVLGNNTSLWGSSLSDTSGVFATPIEITVDNPSKPNLFDFTAWSAGLTAVRGSIIKVANASFTINAILDDTYSNTYNGAGIWIAVQPNTKYCISYDTDINTNTEVFVFYYTDNTDTSANSLGSTSAKRYVFTTPSDCTAIKVRFDVNTAGQTVTFSNIQLIEMSTFSMHALHLKGDAVANVYATNFTYKLYNDSSLLLTQSFTNNKVDWLYPLDQVYNVTHYVVTVSSINKPSYTLRMTNMYDTHLISRQTNNVIGTTTNTDLSQLIPKTSDDTLSLKFTEAKSIKNNITSDDRIPIPIGSGYERSQELVVNTTSPENLIVHGPATQLQFGKYRRNLLEKTDVATYGLGRFITNGSGISVDNTMLYNGKPTIKIDMTTSIEGIQYTDYSYSLKSGETYTYSMMMHSSVASSFVGNAPMHMWIREASVVNPHKEIVLNWTTSIVANTWTRVHVTFKVPANGVYFFKPFVYHGFPLGTIVHVCEIKCECGDAVTPWMPAVEDDMVDASLRVVVDIPTLNSADDFYNISTGETYILGVHGTSAPVVPTLYSGSAYVSMDNKGYMGSLEESVDSAITNKLTRTNSLTVKQNTSTKVNNSFKKTDSLEIASYTPNIITNSSFDNDLTGWGIYHSSPDDGTITVVDGPNGHKALRLRRTTIVDGLRMGVFQAAYRNFAPGAKITISFWARVLEPLTGPSNVVMLRVLHDGLMQDLNCTLGIDTPVSTEWTLYSVTHTLETYTLNTLNAHVLLNSKGCMEVSQIKIEQGEGPTAWVDTNVRLDKSVIENSFSTPDTEVVGLQEAKSSIESSITSADLIPIPTGKLAKHGVDVHLTSSELSSYEDVIVRGPATRAAFGKYKRNLIRNTRDFVDISYWYLSLGPGQTGMIDIVNDATYGKVIHATKTNDAAWWVLGNVSCFYLGRGGTFDTRKTYTLSFKVRSVNSTSIQVDYRNTNGKYPVFTATQTYFTSTAWTQFTHTFTPKHEGVSPVLYISGHIDEYWFTEFKLEVSEEYTGWCPAIEDDSSLNYPSIMQRVNIPDLTDNNDFFNFTTGETYVAGVTSFSSPIEPSLYGSEVYVHSNLAGLVSAVDTDNAKHITAKLGRPDSLRANVTTHNTVRNSFSRPDALKIASYNKNLFVDTDFVGSLNTSYYGVRGTTYSISIDTSNKYNGYNSLKIVGNAAGVTGIDVTMKSSEPINNGGYAYTFSFYAKASAATSMVARFGYVSGSDPIPIGTTWAKHEIVLLTNGVSYDYVLPYFTSACTVWIAQPKLERGTVATPWAADGQSEISNIVASAQRTDQLRYAGNSARTQVTNTFTRTNPLRIQIEGATLPTNIHTLMKDYTRQVYGKVYVTYMNPLIDEKLSIVASNYAPNTRTDQLSDSKIDVANKLFLLSENNLSGDYTVIGENTETGWWSNVLSNADGTFATDPSISVAFSPRLLVSLNVISSILHDIILVDYTVNVTANGVVHPYNITGNTLYDNAISTGALGEVSKIEVIVHKINKAYRSANIMEIPITSTVLYNQEDLISVDLLEELSYKDEVESLGGVSANEVTVTINNADKQFYFNNDASIISRQLKKNRKIVPYLGAEIVPGEIEWYQLGTYWSHAWDVPVGSLYARVTAFDTIGLLNTFEFFNHAVYKDYSVGQLIDVVLTDAKNTYTLLEWEIQSDLYNLIIPYAWFAKGTHMAALERIAQCYRINIYCGRDGKILANKRYSNIDNYYDTWADDTNIKSKNYPTLYTNAPNTINVAITSVQELTGNVASNTLAFSVANFPEFSVSANKPIVGNVVVTVDADATVSYTYTVYSWGVTFSFSGTGTVRTISVDATYLEYAATSIITSRDIESIQLDGVNAMDISNELIQSADQAKALADEILQDASVDLYDTDVEYRGDISISINDPIKMHNGIAPTDMYFIKRHELLWNGSLAGKAKLNT